MKTIWYNLPFAACLSLSAQIDAPDSAAHRGPGDTAPAAMETNAPGATRPADVTGSVAETNSPPAPRKTEIFSDSANFNLKSRIAIYLGNVRVQDSQMKLMCGILTAHLPESGKIDSIVAEQEVVIDALDESGKPVHATANRAVYTYRVANTETNERIDLYGSPSVEYKDGFLTNCETITWDRANGTFSWTGGASHMILQQRPIEFRRNPPIPATNDTNQGQH